MHRDPDRRFPSVAAMIASLAHAAPSAVAPSVTLGPPVPAAATVAATVVMHLDPPSPRPARAPRRLAIAALLTGGIAGALGWTALEERLLHGPVASTPPSVKHVPVEEDPDPMLTAIALSPPIEIGLPEPVPTEPGPERSARPRSRARETAREIAAAARSQLGTNGALILE